MLLGKVRKNQSEICMREWCLKGNYRHVIFFPILLKYVCSQASNKYLLSTCNVSVQF